MRSRTTTRATNRIMSSYTSSIAAAATATSSTTLSSTTSTSNSSSSRHRRDCYVLLLGCCSLFVLGCSWTFHHGLLNVVEDAHNIHVLHHRRVRSNSIALEYERNLYSDLEKSRIVSTNNDKNHTITTTTQYSKQQQQEEDNRPHFVIHVGPHRTGTTFLQASFDQYKVNRNILRQDNYTNLRIGVKSIFQGGHGNASSSSCWNDENDDGPQYHAHKHAESASLLSHSLPRFKTSFQNQIYDLHAKGQHVFWISQGLSKCNVAHVKAMADLLNPLFNVRILVAYRRLYEWLPSRFHQVTNGIGGGGVGSSSLQQEPEQQQQKRRRNSRIDHLWPDQGLFLKDNSIGPPAAHVRRRRQRTRRRRTTTRRVSTTIGTGTNEQQEQQDEEIRHFEQGAAVMRPFDLEHAHLDYNNSTSPVEFTKLIQAIYKLQQHPAEMIRDKYQLFFHDVQVLPLHALHDPFQKTTNNNNNTSSLVSHSQLYHLACSFLPHAKYTCKAAQQGLLQGTWKGNSNNNNSITSSSPLSSTTTIATSVDHDAIAVAAYKKGWINARHSRVDAVQQIARYAAKTKQSSIMLSQSSVSGLSNQTAGMNNGHNNDDAIVNNTATAAMALSPTINRVNDDGDNNNNLDQFYVCPSNATLNRLLQLSLDTERHLFGNKVIKVGQWQENHRQAFMTAAMQEYNSYCWINVTAVLDNDSWRLFLQSLGGGSNKKKTTQTRRMIRSINK